MADYICTVRSNYVNVKDKKAFAKFIKKFECVPIYDDDGRIGFYCDSGGGDAPYYYDQDRDEYLTLVDCAKELGSHLVEGEVLTVEEVGNEKMLYLVGVAYAYNHKGETLFVNMSNELRAKVAGNWGNSDYTEATY